MHEKESSGENDSDHEVPPSLEMSESGESSSSRDRRPDEETFALQPPLSASSLPNMQGVTSLEGLESRKAHSQSLERALSEPHVSWGNVSVRMFPMSLGDHPDCSMGPPVRLPDKTSTSEFFDLLLSCVQLTVDWDPLDEVCQEIDSFERERPRRRHEEELRIDWVDRIRIVRGAGFSAIDVENAQVEVAIAQRQRLHSLKASRHERRDEVVEGFLKKIGRLTRPRRKALTTSY